MSDSQAEGRDVAGLKFNGGRFDRVGFPLDAGSVLSRYRDLVLKAAKLLWRQENPGRRLPNGFESSIHLGLVESQEGSTIPLIQAPLRGSSDSNPLAVRAIEFVNAAFWEIVSLNDLASVKSAFLIDNEILAFNKALNLDETVEFRRSTDGSFCVGAEERDKIREALSRKVENVDGTFIGKLHTIDIDGGYIVKTPTGTIVQGKAVSANRFSDLKALTTQDMETDWIWVEGNVRLTRGRNEKVLVEETRDFGPFGSGSNSRVRRLSSLSLERVLRFGTAAPVELLELVRDISTISPPGFPPGTIPALFTGADAEAPSEGGMRVEWAAPNAHLSVDVDDHLYIGFSLVRLTGEPPQFGEGIRGKQALESALGGLVA